MLKRLKTSLLSLMLMPIFTGCTNDNTDTILIAKLLEDGMIPESVNTGSYKVYSDTDNICLMCKINDNVSNSEYVYILYDVDNNGDTIIYNVQGYNVIWDGLLTSDNMPAIEHNILNSEFNVTYAYENNMLVNI